MHAIQYDSSYTKPAVRPDSGTCPDHQDEFGSPSFEQRESGMTPRVSLRTLILMLELLVAVIAWQYVSTARPAQATALWLAADCHTAASIQRCISDPGAAASVPALGGADTKEP
jgi:hypothetical protein